MGILRNLAFFFAGVRKDDMLGPILFNLYMLAVVMTHEAPKSCSRCSFLTGTSNKKFVVFGRDVSDGGDSFDKGSVHFVDETIPLQK